MATAVQPPQTDQQTGHPPEERFWKRYSPHGELHWSSGVSIALHAVVIGALVLIFLLAEFLPNSPTPPPRMEPVEIEGASGGLDGLGESLANRGKGDQPGKTEGVGSGPVVAGKTLSGLP